MNITAAADATATAAIAAEAAVNFINEFHSNGCIQLFS